MPFLILALVGCIPLAYALGHCRGWRAGRDLADMWRRHAKQIDGLYLSERDLFNQAMEVARRYREHKDLLRAALIDRFTPEERAELQRLTEIAELEQMYHGLENQ